MPARARAPQAARRRCCSGITTRYGRSALLNDMPFARDGNKVRGPGVYDMKGGITQIVFALEAIAHFGLIPCVMPIVFANSDEEIGSRESTRHIAGWPGR